jgi:hypothetical protein
MNSAECSKWKSNMPTRSCTVPKVSDPELTWSRSSTLKSSSLMWLYNKTRATLESSTRWVSLTWVKSGNITSAFWTMTADWPRMKERNKKESKSVPREEATAEVEVTKATPAMVVAVAISLEEVVLSDPVEATILIAQITTTIVVDN